MKSILKNIKIIKKVYLRFIDVSKVYFPAIGVRIRYFIAYGRKLNIKNPNTLSEKLLWLSLNTYSNNLTVLKCSDKYLVREYIEKLGYGDYLNDLLFLWEKPVDINYDELPNKFVLKRSQGCSTNIICKDKNKTSLNEIHQTISNWEKENYWYDKIMAKVGGVGIQELSKFYICEKYMEQGKNKDLIDYKVYCFNGKPICVLVIMDRYSDKSGVFMTPDWEFISFLSGNYAKPVNIPQKPKSLSKIIEISKVLSKEFPFVRVDMYDIEGTAVFGEMTFFPNGCINMQETEIEGKSMGELLDISKEMREFSHRGLTHDK